MLTERTQQAIDILHEIAYHQSHLCPKRKGAALCVPQCATILDQLCAAGLIRLLSGRDAGNCTSYTLCFCLSEITLYQLLLAINENINMVNPLTNEERIYKHYHYGAGALKLGVLNQALCTLSRDIYVIDF